MLKPQPPGGGVLGEVIRLNGGVGVALTRSDWHTYKRRRQDTGMDIMDAGLLQVTERGLS